MKKDNQANMFAELLPPENDKVYWNSMGTVIMNSKTFYKLLTGELSKDKIAVERIKKALKKYEH